jgi:hyperosmotically inducible periplasmic protein
MKNGSKFIQCSVLACGLVAFSQASGPTTALGAQKQQVETGVRKTKEGAEKVGSKTKEVLSTTGEVITDAWITSRVKTRFIGEDALKDSHIDVDTNDHVVTLKGTVLSAAGRSRAIAIAKDTEGVHKVEDRLTIGSKR